MAVDARGYFTQGGIGRYTRELVHALVAQAPHDVAFRLLISNRHSPSDVLRPWGPASACPSERVEIVTSKAGWLDAVEEDQWLDAETSDADLFHSLTGHWLPEGRPSIATLHDLMPLVRPDLVPAAMRATSETIARMLPRASTVIAVSGATARDARRVFGPTTLPIAIVPEAASSVFTLWPPQTTVLVKHHVMANEFVLAVSALSRHKNPARLIEAFANSGIRGPLVIVGAHRDAVDDVHDAIARYSVHHRVHLLGQVPDEELATLYGACRFFVYPSLYEGFGLPALEAMSCGAAVIASNTSSMPEVSGNAAVLVDPTNVDALSRAMHALDHNSALREELRQRGLARAREFSWSKAAAATLAIYDTIPANHEGPKARRSHSWPVATRMAVIVPHYRQAAFLAECLDSLLAQTRPPDEIIVVDSSPQDTREIMPRYTGRVRHLIVPAHGVAAARNAGIRAADATLIVFLDADNVAMPDCLERQERALRDHPDAVMCHGNIIPIDRGGRAYANVSQYGSRAIPADQQLGWLIDRNRVATDTVCVRRDAVVALGGFCETRGVREDYDLWLRLAATGSLVHVDAPLARYRRHETNLSNDPVYMFEWEAGALRRIDWDTTVAALASTFPEPHRRAIAEGEVRLRRGERVEAKRCFEGALGGPQAPAALFHLAHFAFDEGALDAASSYLRRALAGAPDDAALWNNLGVVLALQAQPSGALCAFERALELRSTYDDAAQNLTGLMAGGATREWRVTRRRLRPELMPMSAVA